jgi:hypothetical protein
MDTAQRGKNPRSTYSTFLLSIVRVNLHQISSAHNLHRAPCERTLVESLDGTGEIEDISRWLGGINVLEQEQWQEQTRAESPDPSESRFRSFFTQWKEDQEEEKRQEYNYYTASMGLVRIALLFFPAGFIGVSVHQDLYSFVAVLVI